MTDKSVKEEWRKAYDDVFANKVITAVAGQRLINRRSFDPERARRKADRVFALRDERRRLALRGITTP